MICGVEPAFGRSGASGVEIAGAPGLSNSVTRNAARKMFKTNIAPTRSRAERGHDWRAVRTREPARLTSVLPLSDSSKMPNSMLPVVPARRGNGCVDFCRAHFQQGVRASYPYDRPRARGTRAAVDSAMAQTSVYETSRSDRRQLVSNPVGADQADRKGPKTGLETVCRLPGRYLQIDAAGCPERSGSGILFAGSIHCSQHFRWELSQGPIVRFAEQRQVGVVGACA